MGHLTSSFSRDDIATLLESVGYWEALGSQEFHIMSSVLAAPLPPEDHEAYEVMKQIKEHFRQKEREIKDHQEFRQEKAVFLKAKLMLVRRDMAVNDVFDMAAAETADEPSAPKTKPAVKSKPKDSTKDSAKDSAIAKKLELAEYFLHDLGVWEHYQKFLAEREEANVAASGTSGPPDPSNN